MKRCIAIAIALLFVATVAVVAATAAKQPKTYQVTGPVLEKSDSVIVVQKGEDKWEIGLNADTKITGDPLVGSKVTIMYRMNAASIDVK